MSVLVPRKQRTATRHTLRVPCQVVREDDFSLLGERTMDLSVDGMLVRSDVDAKVGDEVVVSFQATPLGLWFDAEGTVTRIVKGRRPGDEGRALGVKFKNMSYLSRLLLRGHLRRQPPPLPKRSVRVDWAESVRLIAAT